MQDPSHWVQTHLGQVVILLLVHRLRGDNRGVVVGDLPLASDLLPHVGEAGLNRGAGTSIAQLESVQARVEVRLSVAEDLDALVGESAEGVLLDEGYEVVLSVGSVPDVLGGHGREEREIALVVEVGNSLGILGLEGIIPPLEVGLQQKTI